MTNSNSSKRIEFAMFAVVAFLFIMSFFAVPPVKAQDMTDAQIRAGIDARKDRLKSLNEIYTNVSSSIDCTATKVKAEKIICADPLLLEMELIDTRATVYAYENATKTELDHSIYKNNDFVKEWLKKRNKLTTAAAIRRAFIKNTNDNLGGESPYYVKN